MNKQKDTVGAILTIGLVIFIIYTTIFEEKKEESNIEMEKSNYSNTIRNLFTEYTSIHYYKKNIKKEMETFNEEYIGKYILLKGIVKEKKCRNEYPKDDNKKCYIRVEVSIDETFSKSKKAIVYIYANGSFEDYINNLEKLAYINMNCKFVNIGEYNQCKKLVQ